MESQIRSLIEAQRLPPDYRRTVSSFIVPVAARIAEWRAERSGCITVGICGAQGSGKSTLTMFLQALLEARGLRAVSVSLDDFYLTRAERVELAGRLHPLFLTRGTPGTHDVRLGIRVLDGLAGAAPGERVPIPRFDKASDDRRPEVEWDAFTGPADVILFEGWCVGARPQGEEELQAPLNALEREEDPDASWRRSVNAALSGPYQELFSRIDRLILLHAPDFFRVREWRALQERKLREAVGPAARLTMTDGELERFVMHFERITRAVMAEMPQRADLILQIGPDQRPRALMERKGA